MWKRRTDVKHKPAKLDDPAGVISRIADRARMAGYTVGACFLLLPPVAGAQEQVPAPPPILQQQIESCIDNDIVACSLEDRLRLINNLAREMQNLAGEIGLFCELQPDDCPSLDSADSLHGLNQAMNDLIWGLPRYRLDALQLQSQVTGVQEIRPPGPGPVARGQ